MVGFPAQGCAAYRVFGPLERVDSLSALGDAKLNTRSSMTSTIQTTSVSLSGPSRSSSDNFFLLRCRRYGLAFPVQRALGRVDCTRLNRILAHIFTLLPKADFVGLSSVPSASILVNHSSLK